MLLNHHHLLKKIAMNYIFFFFIEQWHGEPIFGFLLKAKRPRGKKPNNKEWVAHLIKKGLDDYISIVKFDSHA